MPIGTIINAGAIIIGSLLGMFFHKAFPKQIQAIALKAIGLSTFCLGLQMALKTENFLPAICSLIIGGIIGELLHLDRLAENFGDFIKSKVNSKSKTFTEGFVTASILFCVGPMAIIGSINDGISGDRTLLLTKSILDGITSIAFASTLGVGVLFSSIPILIYQGSMTILASFVQNFFTDYIINQITAVGGILTVGLAMNMLEINKIKIINLLPSLIIIIIFSLLFH